MKWLARGWRFRTLITLRHVRHLEREIRQWTELAAAERKRAEVAIDVCRTMHQGVAPVTRPHEESAALTARVLEDQLRRAEATFGADLGALGDVRGVDR